MEPANVRRPSTVILYGQDPLLPSLGVAPTFLLALATLIIACEHTSIAGFWPANSLVVALLLQTQPKDRWSALCAGLVALLCARLLVGCPLVSALALSGVNGVEILACAGLVRLAVGDRLDAAQPGHWISFFIAAGVVAPITSALFAGWFFSEARGAPFLPTVSAWYAGDAIGLVVMTPLALAVCQVSLRLWRRYVVADGSSRATH
jgi:integral membrane sensor domain MASE1